MLFIIQRNMKACPVLVCSSAASLLFVSYALYTHSFSRKPRSSIAFYHAKCPDGVTASLYAPSNVKKGWFHGKENYLQEEIAGASVLFCDVCPDPDELKKICSLAKSVEIIDHHKEVSEAALNIARSTPNLKVLYVPDVCASVLMFMRANPGKPIPPFIYHLNNNDTFKKNRESDDLIFWLTSTVKPDPEEYQKLVNLDEEEVKVAISKAREFVQPIRIAAAEMEAAGITLSIADYRVRFVKLTSKIEPNFVWEAVQEADPTVHLLALYEDYKEGENIVIKFRGDPQRYPWVNWMKLRDLIDASGGGHIGAGSMRYLKPKQDASAEDHLLFQTRVDLFKKHPSKLWLNE